MQSDFSTTQAQTNQSEFSNTQTSFNLNKGDLGLPEIFPVKELRRKFFSYIKFRQFSNLAHDNSIDALAINPTTEKEFSTASHDTTLKIWDSQTFKCKSTLKGHEKGVWSLQYDNTGKRMVTSSPDSFVKIWDAKSGKCTDTLSGHTSFVSILEK